MHYAPALHASSFGYVYVLTRGSQSRDSIVMETVTWTHGNNNSVHTTLLHIRLPLSASQLD